MGFSDLGRSMLRYNTRVRRNLRDKYFRNRKKRTGNTSESHEKNKKYVPKLEVRSRDNEYRYLNLSNVTSLVIVIVFTVLAYLAFDKYYGRAHIEYVGNLESLTERVLIQNDVEAYKELTETGFKYLETSQYDNAQSAFGDALRIFKSGKSANYGLTKTLINQCLLKNEYCELSLSYLKKLGKSGVFTEKELGDLERIN